MSEMHSGLTLVFVLLVLISTQLGGFDGLVEGQELELTTANATVTPADECSYCQRVLFMTFVWYQRAGDSSRLFRHKVKHICKRYYEYKRRCLLTLFPKVEMLIDGMRAALATKRYKPISTCKLLKECDKNQSPLDAEEMAALRASAFASEPPPVFNGTFGF
ncbi:hypothetical protein M3Y99_01469400 [Aphelenchoides fujianensis]|nr:hypothetical protein M3Y99_01469400 [Aphelenchoides fujianensis]